MKFHALFIAGIFSLSLYPLTSEAQKKPLDHAVYDTWETLGERKISDNGDWVCYTIDLQEGDGRLVIKNPSKSVEMIIDRGYNATFSNDNQFLIFKIKPLYKDVRDAKIKKKKADEMPKDSLAILSLSNMSIDKIPLVISYKLNEKNQYLAYLSALNAADSTKPIVKKDTTVAKSADTSKKKIPIIIEQTPDKKQKRKLTAKEGGDDWMEDAENGSDEVSLIKEGTDLVVLQLGAASSNILNSFLNMLGVKMASCLLQLLPITKKINRFVHRSSYSGQQKKDWTPFSAKQIKSKTWLLMRMDTRLLFMQKLIQL